MVRTFLKVYMELGSYFLFLQEQIKDIIIIKPPISARLCVCEREPPAQFAYLVPERIALRAASPLYAERAARAAGPCASASPGQDRLFSFFPKSRLHKYKKRIFFRRSNRQRNFSHHWVAKRSPSLGRETNSPKAY